MQHFCRKSDILKVGNCVMLMWKVQIMFLSLLSENINAPREFSQM